MLCGLPVIGSFGRGWAMARTFRRRHRERTYRSFRLFDQTRSSSAAPRDLPVTFSTHRARGASIDRPVIPTFVPGW